MCVCVYYRLCLFVQRLCASTTDVRAAKIEVKLRCSMFGCVILFLCVWACKIAWPIDHFCHEKLSVVTFWFETAFVPSPVAVVVLLASARTV